MCEYAKEGRVRGPNKAKNAMGLGSSSAKNGTNISIDVDSEHSGQRTSGVVSNTGCAQRSAILTGTTSNVVTTQEPSHPPVLCEERSPSTPSSATSLNIHCIPSPSRLNFTPLSHHTQFQTTRLSHNAYTSSISDNLSLETSSGHISNLADSVGLDEHRAFRQRPPNLSFNATGHCRPGSLSGGHQNGWEGQPKGLGLNDLAIERPTFFEDNRRDLYLMRQDQQFFQEQRKLVAFQQNNIQSQNVQMELEYQDLRPQSSSTSVAMTAQSLPHMHSGQGPAFQIQDQMHNPSDEFNFQRVIESSQGLADMTLAAYPIESEMTSGFAYRGSYQHARISHGSEEQGWRLLPSRFEKRLDS